MISQYSSIYSFSKSPYVQNFQPKRPSSRYLSPNGNPQYAGYASAGAREYSQPHGRTRPPSIRQIPSKKTIPSVLSDSLRSDINLYRSGSPVSGNLPGRRQQDVQFNYFKPFSNNDARAFFSEDLLLLLEEQQKNITQFKTKLDDQKHRLTVDFQLFQKQLVHVLDDLRTSLSAQLDIVYKTYIEKYATLKSEVQEVRRLRKQIEASGRKIQQTKALNAASDRRPATKSNSAIIQQMRQDAYNFRHFEILQEIAQLQNSKLAPLQQICQDIIILGKVNKSYYNSDATMTQLYQLKESIAKFTDHMFGFASNYVYSPEKVLKRFSDKFSKVATVNIVPPQIATFNRSPQDNYTRPNTVSDSYQNGRRHIQSEYIFPPNPTTAFINPNQSVTSRRTTTTHTIVNTSQRNLQSVNIVVPGFSIATGHQSILAPNSNSFGIYPIATIKPQAIDTALCALLIDQKFLAIGCRDKNIYVYTLDGRKVATLSAHQASICTLGMIKQGQRMQLASGGDHGCGSVVVWDCSNWTRKHKFRAHECAVSSVVDLGDGVHFCSGSYDKSIQIYSLSKGSMLFKVPHEDSPLTSLVVTSDYKKLVTCGLDSNFHVWSIARNSLGQVESIRKTFSISNTEIICCMTASLLRHDSVYAGGRNGKIYQINADRGIIEKTQVANNKSLMDLALIERNQQPSNQKSFPLTIFVDSPIILSVASKEEHLVCTENDISTILPLSDPAYVEFACGVGPKLFFGGFNNSPVLGVVNQSSNRKQVNIYEIKFQ